MKKQDFIELVEKTNKRIQGLKDLNVDMNITSRLFIVLYHHESFNKRNIVAINDINIIIDGIELAFKY